MDLNWSILDQSTSFFCQNDGDGTLFQPRQPHEATPSRFSQKSIFHLKKWQFWAFWAPIPKHQNDPKIGCILDLASSILDETRLFFGQNAAGSTFFQPRQTQEPSPSRFSLKKQNVLKKRLFWAFLGQFWGPKPRIRDFSSFRWSRVHLAGLYTCSGLRRAHKM